MKNYAGFFLQLSSFLHYTKNMQRLYRLFLALLTLLILAACTTGSDYKRGSLSDAMDKSRDDYEDEREVPNEREPDDWWDDDDSNRRRDEPGDDPPPSSLAPGSGPSLMYLAGRGGNAWHSSPYFDSLFDAEMLLGYREDAVEILLFGGMKAVEAKKSSEIYESVDEGVLFLRAGVELRYSPFPDLPFFSPYVLGQVGGSYMYWSFKNPLDAGSEVIWNDSVGGMILGVGAGLNLVNYAPFRLGIACIPETHLFGSETQEGFQNDVFDYYGTVRWAIEAGLFM